MQVRFPDISPTTDCSNFHRQDDSFKWMHVTTSEIYWHGNLNLWRGGSKCVYMYVCICIYVCVYVYMYIHMYMCVCMCVYTYTHIWQHTRIHVYTWPQRHLLRTLRKLRSCPKNAGMHTPGHLVTTSYPILGNSGSSDDYEDYSLRCWLFVHGTVKWIHGRTGPHITRERCRCQHACKLHHLRKFPLGDPLNLEHSRVLAQKRNL